MGKFSPPPLRRGRFEKGRSIFITLGKAVGITGLAFLLSFLLSSPVVANISVLFSTSEKSDFVISDLFYQIADSRPVRTLEDRIVILDIGNCNRQEIAELLSVVALCEPKAVALDINFELPGDDDSQLLESLSSLPVLVLPLGVRQEGESFSVSDKPFFYNDLDNVTYGVVNFPTDRAGATVREYAKSFPMTDGGRLMSFPEAVADKAGYPAHTSDAETGVDTGIICYHSKEIKTIPYEELEERAEELTDRIVLVGSTSEASDIYNIPLRNKVSGLEIHAYSLSTILDGVEYKRIPGYIATIISVAVCFLIILGAVSIRSLIRGLVLRIAQVLALYVLVRVGYSLFVDHGIVSDFSQAVLMLAFGLFAVDLWNGTEALIVWLICRLRRYREKRLKMNPIN